MDDIESFFDEVFKNFDFEYRLSDALQFLFIRTVCNASMEKILLVKK